MSYLIREILLIQFENKNTACTDTKVTEAQILMVQKLPDAVMLLKPTCKQLLREHPN